MFWVISHFFVSYIIPYVFINSFDALSENLQCKWSWKYRKNIKWEGVSKLLTGSVHTQRHTVWYHTGKKKERKENTNTY